MQPSQCVARGGEGLVVLVEIRIDPVLDQLGAIVGDAEITAVITESRRLDQEGAFDWKRFNGEFGIAHLPATPKVRALDRAVLTLDRIPVSRPAPQPLMCKCSCARAIALIKPG